MGEREQLARLVIGGDAFRQIPIDRRRHHRLSLAHGLAQLLGESQLGGHVGRILDDLERLALHIEDRIEARLNPHFAAALGHGLVLAGVVLATGESRPQCSIPTLALACVHEDPVRLAAQLLEAVAGQAQEVGVGRAEGAVEIELGHGLRLADGRQLAEAIGELEHLLGDVDRVLDDLERPSAPVEDREIGRLDPDGLAVLAQPLVLGRLGLPGAQAVPEGTVGGGIAVGGIHEAAVVHRAQVGKRVARGLAEILVRRQDIALQVELDDRELAANGLDLPEHIGIPTGAAQQRDAELKGIPGHGALAPLSAEPPSP